MLPGEGCSVRDADERMWASRNPLLLLAFQFHAGRQSLPYRTGTIDVACCSYSYSYGSHLATMWNSDETGTRTVCRAILSST
eukprot:scaffold123743_cov46-Prasinocladus_malaysianus.AAC.3